MNTNHLFTEPDATNHRHLTEEGVALYADALLLQRSDELPTSLREHVEGCLECEMQIMGVYEISKKLGPVSVSTPHPYFDRESSGNKVRELAARYTTYYRIAAVIGGAALLAAGYYALMNGSTHEPTIISQQNKPAQQTVVEQPKATAAPKQETAQLLADNFAESSNLEDLTHGEFRSTTVEVLSPSVGQAVRQPIVFQWKNMDEPVTIKILSNKERTLVSSTVKGNSYTFKKKLSQGLYYWKLESEKELLFVGKFLVK